MARRQFLGGVLGGAAGVVGGLGALAQPSFAEQLKKEQKLALVF